jgi:hypothetical protein
MISLAKYKLFVVTFVLISSIIVSVIPANATVKWQRLTAYAGPDQLNALVGEQVYLNSMGSAQTCDKLSYRWTFTSQASGSQGFIFADNTAQAYFIPDVPGRYTIKLTVFDPIDGRTATDCIIVNAGTAPVATASSTGTPALNN